MTSALEALLAAACAAVEGPPGVPVRFRKVGPIVGGWVLSNGRLDHHHYLSRSIRSTIELSLGLHPLSRYDFGATPMTDCCGGRSSNQAPFGAIKFQSHEEPAHEATAGSG